VAIAQTQSWLGLQSIYSFAGAESKICAHFLRAFNPATQVALGRNFRSQAEIVGACSELIRHNKDRFRYVASSLPFFKHAGLSAFLLVVPCARLEYLHHFQVTNPWLHTLPCVFVGGYFE
jgi:hypothetical protein